MVAFRRCAAALLLVSAACASAVIGTVLLVDVGSTRAYAEGVLHGRGRLEDYVVQAPEALAPLLGHHQELVAVTTEDGYLSTSVRGVEGVFLTATAPSRAGLSVLAGRLPRTATEVAISSEGASTLHLQVGRSLRISSSSTNQTAQVVGIVVNPAVKDLIAVYRQGLSLGARRADYWIVDPADLSRLEQQGDLRGPLAAGSLSVSSNRVLVADALDHRPPRLRLLGTALWISVATAGATLISVLASLTGGARRDVRGLEASGLSARAAWGCCATSTALLVALGGVLGSLASALAVSNIRGPLESWTNQHWVQSPAPFPPLATVVFAVVATVACYAAARYLVAEATRAVTSRRPPTRAARLVQPVATGSAGAALLATSALAPPSNGTQILLGATGFVLILHGALPLLLALARGALPTASRRLVAEVIRRRALPLVLGGTVSALVAAYVVATAAAPVGDDARTPPPQPAGSFLALQVPDLDVQEIVTAFHRLGGQDQLVYGMPRSRFGDIRASSSLRGTPKLQYVAFDSRLPVRSVTASPALAHGPVDIAPYPGTSGGKKMTVRVGEDTRLGGDLPAVLVSPRGPVARALDMAPSGFSMVALLDYEALPGSDQAELRSLVARVAPSALTSLASDGDIASEDRGTGLLVALVGTAGAAAAALAGLLSSGVALRDVRRCLRELGFGRSARRRMGLVTILAELVPLAGVIVYLRLDGHPPVGLTWALPFLGQALLALLTCLFLYSVPAKPGRFRRDRR